MRLKTVSTNNETTYGERRRQEEQIQWILKISKCMSILSMEQQEI